MRCSLVCSRFAISSCGERNDLWSVNTDQEYLEEIREEVQVLTDDIATGGRRSTDPGFLET